MERIIIGFIFGAIVGSFLDCIANRSVTNTSFWGRSFCDHCHKTLSWYELVPIVSYIFQKGRCTKCHKKVSPESTLVEIITGLITAFIVFSSIPPAFITQDWINQLNSVVDVIFKLFATYVFLAVFITDFKTGLIPDRITYPSIVTAVVLLLLFGLIKSGLFYYGLKMSPLGSYLLPPHSDYFYRHVQYIFEPVLGSILSGVGIGLFFLLLILVTAGRGMGGGDMKLGVFIGLAVGFPQSVLVIMLAFFLGSIFGIILILSRLKKFGQTIPFGPFLSLASIIGLFWGQQLVDWYLNLRIF